MGEILLLEELFDEIAGSEEECTLFGKTHYVQTPGGDYDLLFHSIEGIPVSRIKIKPYLAVPVLGYRLPADSDKAKISMYEMHKINPSVMVFAVRDERAQVQTFKGQTQVIEKPCLKFFDLSIVDAGIEITPRKRYLLAGEQQFREAFPDWDNIKKYLSEARGEIDRLYKS